MPEKSMPQELKNAMQAVVDYLDDCMVKAPTRELADTSNYLQRILNKESK